MKKLVLTSILSIAAFASTFAQDTEVPKRPLKFLITTAFEFGGDQVAEVYFTNGETQSVRAGQGGTLSVGAQYQFPQMERLLLRGTVGFKYVTTAAENAHIRLTRFPLQLTGNWMATDKLRLGAGLVTHQGITFNTDGLGKDVDIDGATGPVFEIAYGVVGLSYTVMQYKDEYKNTYSANAIGLTLSFVIPKKERI